MWDTSPSSVSIAPLGRTSKRVTAATGCAMRSRKSRTSIPSSAHVRMRSVALWDTTSTRPSGCSARTRSITGAARAATWNAVSPPGVPRLAVSADQYA